MHGVNEHIGRYNGLANRLTKEGYAVFGHDHLGHGGEAEGKHARKWLRPLMLMDSDVSSLWVVLCLDSLFVGGGIQRVVASRETSSASTS